MNAMDRREFLHRLGISTAALPLLSGLPELRAASADKVHAKRVVFLFSPNGIVPEAFWPDQAGPEFNLKPILTPLEPFKDRRWSSRASPTRCAATATTTCAA